MSEELRSAYDTIADAYLSKKQPPWHDFIRFVEMVDLSEVSSVIDVGAANGRNLHGITAGLHVAMDLSYELLQGYVGPENGQRVAGALPSLPFRSQSSDLVMAIAVIHHIHPEQEVIQSLVDIKRVGTYQADFIISVWRRWRRGWKEKILNAMQKGEDIDPLINHQRPWYNSQREVQAIRFYHYYTFRELYAQLKQAGLSIKKTKYLGGKHEDANIFVKVSSQLKRE